MGPDASRGGGAAQSGWSVPPVGGCAGGLGVSRSCCPPVSWLSTNERLASSLVAEFSPVNADGSSMPDQRNPAFRSLAGAVEQPLQAMCQGSPRFAANVESVRWDRTWGDSIMSKRRVLLAAVVALMAVGTYPNLPSRSRQISPTRTCPSRWGPRSRLTA